jgi:UDP-GlcNAc3NAcA epimerase
MPKFKIASIVGARPQFIKAAAISRAFLADFGDQAEEFIIHTGQHYDDNMSKVFFEEMAIPHPKYHLEVGSGTHGNMTAEIIRRTEEVLLKEKPDLLIVFGDTNTTLGGAIAASKLHIPVAHVEAGLRSFNKSMPEEINRVLCDHVSTLLFSPTPTGVRNLVKEGFRMDNQSPYSPDNPKVFHCGDVMYDTAKFYLAKAETSSTILANHGLSGKDYTLCTIHRDNNTDDPVRLSGILTALDQITREFNMHVVMPVHPRTTKMLKALPDQQLVEKIRSNPMMILLEPLGYLDMLVLESHARIVLTDSGGVQKEAYFFRKPCIVMRTETEWKELIEVKAAVLANADKDNILEAFRNFYHEPPAHFPSLYGDGHAAAFICREIVSFLK